jgi:hypothetical protein
VHFYTFSFSLIFSLIDMFTSAFIFFIWSSLWFNKVSLRLNYNNYRNVQILKKSKFKFLFSHFNIFLYGMVITSSFLASTISQARWTFSKDSTNSILFCSRSFSYLTRSFSRFLNSFVMNEICSSC